MDNPFIYRAYKSKDLFCDRENELQKLLTDCISSADVTLISQRRIGKTGLIFRLFDEIKSQNLPITSIYVDIFATRSLADFIKAISEAVLQTFPETNSFGKQFLSFLRSLRPLLSFDPITSMPQVQINYQNEAEKENTLKSIFDFLNSQGEPIVMAIDEFQQIRNYPEQNVEALLRTEIQTRNNVSFIFCGSKKRLMLDIFSNDKKPFYRSTEFLSIDKIEAEKYAEFIQYQFETNHRHITRESIQYILDWTRRHTYFTQRLCHYTFNINKETIEIEDVKESCAQILQSDEIIFNQYQQILTNGQWNLLIAIAKEVSVEKITSKVFLQKYHLGTPSSVSRTLNALLDKDLVIEESWGGRSFYSLNDVFLSRWLSAKY